MRVALGTDSRASNPDLCLWSEMRHVAAKHPGVSPEQVLHMGTLMGAEALGIDADVGSITIGKRADLVVLPLPVTIGRPSEALEMQLKGEDHTSPQLLTPVGS